ncbi:TetR/AcrR family transcriptional regulator C-terminal domain-containing protein [Paenarthrobacter sp. PH39-S1]|uniref:TetR/AcrR family transcriptional regulator C-terminal domain-containing protein n=1 Tax=Paenarthrobacter sp. PH39-S1 TaxID=3046204 RepID=UPI0024BB3E43|nr:TetR/AcrR family transcriptional regulator C-terminal domain-containing protein [Paenarthrobacter sp. PH39-S1]MDJ0356236.1 TetR/AcrR family transcriptional regulator C-terminal domain-containing protein [Paenarthrobacter sp. PH39-S1]
MARPLTPLLSVERIAKSALALVDHSGEFTIPGLAAKLGVRPSSLYNHVSGRAEIVELMRGLASDHIHLPHHGSDWYATVTEICRQYHNSYARHPRLIPLLTAYPVSHPATTRMYNLLAEVLTDAGFDPVEVLKAITTLDSFVLGSALDVAAPEVVWTPGDQAGPALAAALATPPPSTQQRSDEAFDYGLRIVMNGLAQQLDAIQRRTAHH